MSYKVSISGVNTASIPKLSKKEGAELLQLISQGDDQARQRFLFANLRLVLSIVHRFSFPPELADDVFQVGCLGLTKALNNFDFSLGVMFSTYAVPMIIGEIRRFLRETSALKVSRNLRDIAFKIMQTREAYARAGNNEPELYEIAADLGIPLRDVNEALDAIADPISLYEPAYNDGDESVLVMDQISDNANNESGWVERMDLKSALQRLTEKERQVIELRYYKGQTQTEVSSYCNISQAQVSRLENTAIKKLRFELCGH